MYLFKIRLYRDSSFSFLASQQANNTSHSSHHARYYHQQTHQNQSRHHDSLSNHHSHHEKAQHNYSHHESADGIRHELDNLANENWAQSPGSDVSVDSSARVPSSSIASISSGIGSTPLKPSMPSLTPTHVNYYDEKLIQHIINWPSEQIEKQVRLLPISTRIIFLIISSLFNVDKELGGRSS